MLKKMTLSSTEYTKLIKNLETELLTSYQAIKGLHDNYEALLKGDSEGPYWNGATALTFYNRAKRNLDNDIVAYNSVYKLYDKIVQRNKRLFQKGYFVSQ